MLLIFAQSGLAIMALVAMYIIYGLPLFAAIAAVAAILGGHRGRERSGLGLGWSRGLFLKTFLGLALGAGALVLAACIREAWRIHGR